MPALADGAFSAPFRTPAGWHIVQRLGVRQNDATDQNRRAQVRETIGRRKLEDEWSRFLRNMRGEAFVHKSRIPLDQIDLSLDTRQGDMFANECSGSCGL